MHRRSAVAVRNRETALMQSCIWILDGTNPVRLISEAPKTRPSVPASVERKPEFHKPFDSRFGMSCESSVMFTDSSAYRAEA